MLRTWISLIAVCVACAALPAAARDWPTTAGWDVLEGDDYCSIHLQFEGKGETELSLLLNTDDTVLLGLSNSGWSIAKGEKQDLTYGINGSIYSGAKSIGVGDIDGKKGFAMKFGSEFLKDFAASPYLIVRKGDVLVDNLSLKGSGPALVVAKRCLAALKRDIAAADAEKRRFSNIADDPFAKPGATPLSTAEPVKGGPKGNPGSWFSNDDYPADARRAGASGRVAVWLSIDTAGLVVDCRVTASSGNASLDAQTCNLAKRRGRFSIQKGKDGTPEAYTWPVTTTWTLNGE